MATKNDRARSRFGLTPDQEQTLTGRFATAYTILAFIAEKGDATCDEVLAAKKLPHQTGSSFFTKLKNAGCLVATRKKRYTRHDKPAIVYKVAKNADFMRYVRLRGVRVVKKPGISDEEAMALGIMREFIDKWRSSRSPSARESALKAHVQKVIILAGKA